MYIIELEPISMAYFINPSHQSVCLCVYPPIIAMQRFGKHAPASTNTRNRRNVGRVVFYTVRVVSNESLWVRLCIPNFSPATAKFKKTWIYTPTPLNDL
jgi:hypothetical protein